MTFQHEQFRKDTLEAWGNFLDALETSIQDLQKDIDEAADMTQRCTSEWCAATEHVIDEINDALFSISEPRWTPDEYSRRIKSLKRQVRELYVKYKAGPADKAAA